MTTIYTDRKDSTIDRIIRKCYPEYTGTKVRIEINEHPINCKSYWEGGSRDYFVFIKLDTLEVSQEMPAQSAFDTQVKGLDSVSLVPGIVCVKHTIFCGKDLGITIIIHPDNANQIALPKSIELTQEEKKVLICTRSLKSSYAGIKNFRQSQSGLTMEVWEATKQTLISKGYLNKAGAITNEGRNAIGNERL